MSAAIKLVREPRLHQAEKLIRTITLEVQPMTPEAFAPYGVLIGKYGAVDLDLDGGVASVAVQRVEARPRTFDFLGRHQRTEQVFIPLGGAKSIIAVAAPSAKHEDLPDVRRMAAFLSDASCAFKLHRGTWHATAFPLMERASFVVIDRQGTLDQDFDLRDLKTTLGVVVEIRS
jgi:ureidoglycolate lyase